VPDFFYNVALTPQDHNIHNAIAALDTVVEPRGRGRRLQMEPMGSGDLERASAPPRKPEIGRRTCRRDRAGTTRSAVERDVDLR